MIIKIDDCYGEVVIEEFLEPTGSEYEIRQGDNKIKLSSYLASELGRVIKFLTNNYDN